MKRFGTIFRFEFSGYLKNKAFIGFTIFLVVLIVGITFFPRIMELFDSGEPEPEEPGGITSEEPGDLPVMLLLDDGGDHVAESLGELLAGSFPEYEVKITTDGVDAAKRQVGDGEAECALAFSSPTSYTYYVNNLSMYDFNTSAVDEILVGAYRMNAMVSGGISPEDAEAILSTVIEHTTETLGQDQMQNFLYTYIMIYALYIVIILYGQLVATSVATEKSSRAMEVLITSARPLEMMFGKVMAACAAGFSQLVVIFGTALACFTVNKSYWADIDIISSIFNMPPMLLVYMLVFFVLGFLIYAFLFGAVGSTVSKVEDINTAAMPLTMIFVVGFIIVIMAISFGNVDTTLMRVCSFIPFTSPMAMFTRIAMGTVPAYEIAIAISILVVSAVLIGIIAAKIYRVGVLLYGNPPKPSAILKAIRKA